MNITKYQELTGTTVPSSSQSSYIAQIKRARTMLENMLGYTLDKNQTSTNHYDELGKTPSDFIIPDSTDDLLAPDSYTVGYRLFPYNTADKYIPIDPCTAIYSVKLVYTRQGGAPNGITVKTFDIDEYGLSMSEGNIYKYIQKIDPCWWTWWNTCGCSDFENFQVAVDAEWLFYDCLPSELQYLWADMVTYLADCKKDIKSESLGSHSYTKFDQKSPELLPLNQRIINKYAGPYGAVNQVPTL